MKVVGAVLDALSDAALLLGPDGRVAVANAPAQARFGVWIVGQSYVSALRQPPILSLVDGCFAHGAGGAVEVTHVAEGVESRLRLQLTPLVLDRGLHALLVFRDVSAAKRDEALQSAFVANVSHELKTPLTAILGFIDTLEGPARDDAGGRARFLGLMRREAERMSRLVADLMSLARVEAQAARRPTARLDWAEVVRGAAEPLEDRMAVEMRLGGPAWVRGDADQLVQVATNLLENALRYGGGAAEVALDHVAREPVLRGPAWRMTVRDRGPGIAPEHVPRLTDRFYRVDAHRSRAAGGTGLGLAIVKHIVTRHRGRLRIDSALGRGTSVAVLLPDAS
nr:ATP-binding protein [Jannaschia sp. Os4]